jgi:hypothetical protein
LYAFIAYNVLMNGRSGKELFAVGQVKAIEVHYFRHPDGSVGDVKIKPRS